MSINKATIQPACVKCEVNSSLPSNSGILEGWGELLSEEDAKQFIVDNAEGGVIAMVRAIYKAGYERALTVN